MRRSVHLFRAFLVEQPDPDRFYSALAEDSVATLAEHVFLDGAVVLDVGAGPRQFADAFTTRGATYLPLDHDKSVSSLTRGGVAGSALALPFADGSIDVVFSSNLWEHVPDPITAADEMVRVLRPGGVLYLSYTNWLSPWGGHETSPWHWVSADYAVRRYTRKYGRRPKNIVGETMHKVTIATGLKWASAHRHIEVLAARPRYYPDWMRHVLALPGLRELLTWNLLLIARRRPVEPRDGMFGEVLSHRRPTG